MLKETVGPGLVVDLASGTGILAGQLVRARREVVAVEPIEEMLGQLRLSLPALNAVRGTAEAIPLRHGVAAAVTVGQAFHWFDAPRALSEIARVLQPGGTLAMLFNVRDESVGWVRELTDLIEARSGGRPYGDQADPSWGAVISRSGYFESAVSDRFDNPVRSSRAAVLDRVRSTSVVAAMQDSPRESLLGEIEDVLDAAPETAGRARFDYPHHTEIRCWTLRGS